MVAQRLGSQSGSSDGNGETQVETRIQTQDPVSNPLAKQGSLYSLTLDEVQNLLGDLGKPLSSMNLDELLKAVRTAEVYGKATGGEASGPAVQEARRPASGSNLNQHSSLMLSMDLSNKTVDEVWKDILQGQKSGSLDRNATLGEITLEDFLVKAGVFGESTAGKKNLGSVRGGADPILLSQQAEWMNHQVPSMHSQLQQKQDMLAVFVPDHPVQQHNPVAGNPTLDAAYPETQIALSSSPLAGTLSDIQTPGQKRAAPGDIAERSVERRQKRMIKNRESAARSRARKQAYTHELENKISRLEEENERLKRQKELEKVLPAIPFPEPKYQLRRTSSAPI